MGRMYTVETNGVAKTAQTDLFELTPADDKPLIIHAIFVSQTSDFGDAQDEGLLIQVIRGFTSSGSGGSSPSVRPQDRSGASAGFTAEANNTTVATTGTTHTLHSDMWQVRIPYQLIFTPEMRPSVSQADTTIVIRAAAPADSITMNATVYVEEVG